MISNESSDNRHPITVIVSAVASVSYCLIVIWYVTTFPDIGLRCLLPTEHNETELHITEFVHEDGDVLGPPISADDKLVEVARKPAPNFLLFIQNVAQLRSAAIPPGGLLAPGSDPSEEPTVKVPELVEIPDGQSDNVTRMVELQVRLAQSEFPKPQRTYVAVKSLAPSEFVLTIVWFLCQLGILLVAITVWWQRPGDDVVRIFCLMCSASMVAFVGGFHWWILVASPLLNLPFIFCACLLPAVTLHFFCSFPRENSFVSQNRLLANSLIYGPPLAAAGIIALTYWAAYALSGGAVEPSQFSGFQKLTALISSLTAEGAVHFDSLKVVAALLYLLRLFVHSAIVLASIYFGLTVMSLAVSLLRTSNPVEQRQASGILTASLIATVPIGYTLYLAFFQREGFALGRAQFPMFLASGLFMAAYAHGMLKHRLILADETLFRGRQYFLTSSLVSFLTALVLAVGAVATRVYALPKNPSIPLHLVSFLVLLIAVGFILWARDRIQSMVDQRFFSEKYQIDKTLKQLNQASGYLADPSALADITLTTCRDVIDAANASMYVREPRGTLRLIGADQASGVPGTLPASSVENVDDSRLVVRRIPMVQRDHQSPMQKLLYDLKAEVLCLLRSDTGIDGLIVLGRRSNGSSYSPEDIAFLQAIGQMTVLALHSSRANQNLARLNAELEVKVDRIAEQQRQLSILRAELTSLQQADAPDHRVADSDGFDRGEIRGNSGRIQSVLQMARKAAASTATVLIRGESGTGKELLARVVHRNSDRKNKPLVTVNCAALAPSLLESELFGHVRGAFTGANSDKEGRFKAAHGGTLFLDEIGDISLEVQVKLLRVLQERCFEPVGSNRTEKVDVRLIAATNRNLEEMIESGQFREDLYYRLNVVSMTLPALRERRDDLIELVFFFLNRGVQKTGKVIRQIDPEALEAIECYHWPGNIRQLENAVERAIVLADGDTITLKDLPTETTAAAQPIAVDTTMTSAATTPATGRFNDRQTRRILDIADSSMTSAGTDVRSRKASGQQTPLRSSGEDSQHERLGADEQRREQHQLQQALDGAGGNKARAARSLGMPRSTFYSKLKKYGLAE